MIRIASETEFLAAFRPVDRKLVDRLPEGLEFPLLIVDYVAWTSLENGRIFMVFGDPGSSHAVGVAFRRDQGRGSPGATPASAICDWCHAYGSSDQVGLLTATVNSKRRVGINLCLDLSCKRKVEGNLIENPRLKMRKVVDRMSQFARRNLF